MSALARESVARAKPAGYRRIDKHLQHVEGALGFDESSDTRSLAAALLS